MQNGDIQINVQTIGGETPLMKAATMGHRDIIQQLLAAGANAGLQSHNGLTARDFAEINHKGTGLAEIFPWMSKAHKINSIDIDGLFVRAIDLINDVSNDDDKANEVD